MIYTKDKKICKLNNRGNTLLGVMMASSLGLIILLGFADVYKNLNRLQKRTEQSSQGESLKLLVASVLLNEESCKRAFKHNGSALLKITQNFSVPYKISSINLGNNPLVTAGKDTSGAQYDLTITEFLTSSGTVTIGPFRSALILEVSFTKGVDNDGTLLPGGIRTNVWKYLINVISDSTSGEIESCSSDPNFSLVGSDRITYLNYKTTCININENFNNSLSPSPATHPPVPAAPGDCSPESCDTQSIEGNITCVNDSYTYVTGLYQPTEKRYTVARRACSRQCTFVSSKPGFLSYHDPGTQNLIQPGLFSYDDVLGASPKYARSIISGKSCNLSTGGPISGVNGENRSSLANRKNENFWDYSNEKTLIAFTHWSDQFIPPAENQRFKYKPTSIYFMPLKKDCAP